MAKTESITQQKFRVLSKLFDLGCKTKNDLLKLDMDQILNIEGITISDMKIIMKIQKSVKAGKLYEYLGGDDNERTAEQTHNLE
jgi:hypothetical protein